MITPRLQTLRDLFSDEVCYQVPVYQRPYAWNRDEQWEPFWSDLISTTERRLDGDGDTPAHFLGAIVIDLVSAEPGRVKRYTIIDGQQRLTTIQLLIAALRDEWADLAPEQSAELQQLLRNTGRHAEGDLAFKVWPGRHDQPPFQGAIEDPDAIEAAQDGIAGGYGFFRETAREWLVADGQARARDRLDALHDVLDGLLQLVSIQLDGSSDAQIIFETLNSRGADLTSLDLAKNALFHLAARGGEDSEQLHDDIWMPALGDADYWLEPIRQGRYTRERADLFLMHWLTMKLGQPARLQHLFADFRLHILADQNGPPDAASLLEELCDDAITYRSFDSLDPESHDGKFFRRLDQMDTTTLIPVALLLWRTAELAPERRHRALAAMESWLVRRMLMGSTTRAYNRLLASLLSTLHEQRTLAAADEVIIEQLSSFENPTDQWPADDEVRVRLEGTGLYGWINQKRIRMLMEACEQAIAAEGNAEEIPLPENLSIEHAMPREWEANWPLPGEDDPETEAATRNKHVDLIGNLTVITQRLNSSMSNAGWAAKRQELRSRSQLLVNQILVGNTEWDETRIDDRSSDLAGHIIATWPGPDAARWKEDP